MTTQINIKKTDLINIISNNTNDFGSPFLGIYVDANGELDCTEKKSAGDAMPVLEFSGMGEFIDGNSNYPNDDYYDNTGVAAYIVDDGECLMFSGSALNDDGAETEYSFVIN